MSAVYVRQQFSDDQWDLVMVAVQSDAFRRNLEVRERMGVTILTFNESDSQGFVDEPAGEIIAGTRWGKDHIKNVAKARSLDVSTASALTVAAARFIKRISSEHCEAEVPAEDPWPCE